jgi:hypothetical protein
MKTLILATNDTSAGRLKASKAADRVITHYKSTKLNLLRGAGANLSASASAPLLHSPLFLCLCKET